MNLHLQVLAEGRNSNDTGYPSKALLGMMPSVLDVELLFRDHAKCLRPKGDWRKDHQSLYSL
jgi:hypothetical protein